jgi:predicted acetyltransferase
MAITFGGLAAGEVERFLAVVEEAAGRRLSEEVLQDMLEMYDERRLWAAFDDHMLVGGTGSDLLELTVPGLIVLPVARITHTGVLPTHRRRGLAVELFARQVRALHSEGLALAVFTTSGPGIYRTVGYAPASLTTDLMIDLIRGDPGIDEPIGGTGEYRLIEAERMAELRALFEAHRCVTPGQISRTAAFWNVWGRDRERYRPADTNERSGVTWSDGGYLTYRRSRDGTTLVVEELIAADSATHRALWEWCLGFDQVRSIGASNVPPDEPMRWALRDPRRPRVTRLRDFLWLRVLDVTAALSARRYAAADSIVLGIDDEVCSANSGAYRLDARADDAPTCTPSRNDPDLRLGIAELSAAYLGGVTFTSLARAGRIVAAADDALARADRLFQCSPLPWTVTAF